MKVKIQTMLGDIVVRLYDDTPIFLKASVLFESTYYVFNGTTYKYGAYPIPTQIDSFIKEIKDYVLTTIQKATESE